MLNLRFAAIPALALLLAAAPVDPVRDAIIKQSAAMSPAQIKFTRTVTLTRRAPTGTSKTVRVDSWDGQRWALISIDGKPPTPQQIAEADKAAAGGTVPGYHNIAKMLAAATESRRDADGRLVLVIPRLPAGMVRTNGNDISDNLAGQAFVATAKGKPFVQQLKISAREPFSLNMTTKISAFTQVTDYQLDANGRPRLVGQHFDSTGSMFGISGGQSSETVFSYR
ncbi:MAG: hypothetical protein WCO82_06115 [Sphingomonadales bacterium]|jgi:hypothetical protein